MFKTLYSVIILVFCPLAQAQNAWTWKDCIAYALENNLDIKNAELYGASDLINEKAAVYSFLPSLNANTGGSISVGKSIDYSTNDFVYEQNIYNSLGIYTNVKLFNSFARINQIRFYQYKTLMGKAQIEQTKQQVSFAVLNAFCNVALYQQLGQLLHQKLSLSQQEYARINKMYSLGSKAGSDILEIQAQISADSFYIVQNNSLLQNAYFRLMEEMNLEYSSDFSIQAPEIFIRENDTIVLDSLVESALDFLPDVKMLEYQLLATQQKLSMTRARYFPSVNLNAGVSSDYFKNQSNANTEMYGNQLKNNLNEFVGISVSLPIFNRLEVYNSLKYSKIELKIQENNLTKELLLTENEVKQAFQDLQQAKSEYLMAVNQLQARKMAMDVARAKYEKGLMDIITYSMAKNEMSNAEIQVLRTSLQLFLKEKTIAFFMNQNI